MEDGARRWWSVWEGKERRKKVGVTFFLLVEDGEDWDGGRCGKVVVGMGEKIKKKESLFQLSFFFIGMVGE